MEAFLISTGVVALAEIGDKTQLLAFILAAKFRRPWPIILGILVATIVNHAGAGALGAWIMSVAGPEVMRWVLGLGFIVMAGWTLIPDKFDEDDAQTANRSHYGVFGTTVVAFFLAFYAVVAGTTFGMMLANVPAVLLGDRIANRIPVRVVHAVAALIFLALGIATLLGAGAKFGF